MNDVKIALCNCKSILHDNTFLKLKMFLKRDLEVV